HPVRRQVALKILKPGMDSKQVIARFEAERQALALMDHPNIAKVLDSGTMPLRIGDCGMRIEERQGAPPPNPQSEIRNLQSLGPLRIGDCGTRIEEKQGAPPPNPQSEIRNLQSPGRPYFVMELVKGVPITEFCDRSQFTARERLRLFVDV